jgi:sugar phosphate isomerase/epimerase
MQTGRRQFLAATTGLAVAAMKMQAEPLGLPIGTQTYPVRDAISKDFEGTLRDIASMGYKTIEMCSPQGYAKSGFGALADMKAGELRKKIEGAGLRCESSHYTFRELKEDLPERIAYAKELGLKQIILASFGLRQASLSDWARVAGELNKIAEQISQSGLQTGFHNHDGEFEKVDGVVIFDKLMGELDPKLVKMQFQVAVVRMGVDAPALFDKYPGRFISMHLQDFSAADKRMTAVGKGAVDWKQLFSKAKKAGVKNYFVELSREHMKDSFDYLHKLKV